MPWFAGGKAAKLGLSQVVELQPEFIVFGAEFEALAEIDDRAMGARSGRPACTPRLVRPRVLPWVAWAVETG